MRLVGWTSAAVLMLDQVSKYIVVHLMALDRVGAIDVYPPWFNLRMAWNRGINFGLFSGEDEITRWALIVIALAISAWVWGWVARGTHARRAHLASGLLIGGALGNVIDRLAYGAVADFLNMSLPFWQNPYSFNVADIAIFAGAAGLVFFTGEGNAKRRS
ncbi:signal peptidase II [Rhodobacter sp. TJ_12]|uniref:signal peptidase II n=1 Tax=Rhodobacter sp. TJ_12 TaxID=2029399 RepID=UPI001CC071C2|nr:signal peptidase II [Rhodobacter sp. TJ_12]MBZ4020974.1 signal peptidase II [Rhodobacter sp. TJ_12]